MNSSVVSDENKGAFFGLGPISPQQHYTFIRYDVKSPDHTRILIYAVSPGACVILQK